MRRIEYRAPVLAAGSRRILYVEDNDDNWNVADARLSKIYLLQRAATDAEACRLLKDHGSDLYVVLMDIELTGSQLDGVALTRLIRGTLPETQKPDYARDVPTLDVPVIFVTAYHTELTPTLAAAGGTMLIPKPVEFRRLTRALTTMHLERIEPLDAASGSKT